MAEIVDYYFSLNSPWTYMGHRRLTELADRYAIDIRVHPVDFGGTIFPATGGLPVGKRSPQRQAYRLVELARWRKRLGVELNIQPAFWPADEALAAGMLLAARETGAAAVTFAGAIMAGVWAEERNIADRGTLLAIAGECDLDGDKLMAAAETQEMGQLRASESKGAIDRGVFGAPSYLYDEELFWGQDRLELLESAIKSKQ
jgi:2-hydroxychromene-2-carboxylate isomerase